MSRGQRDLVLVAFGAKTGRTGLVNKEKAILQIVRTAMAEKS